MEAIPLCLLLNKPHLTEQMWSVVDILSVG